MTDAGELHDERELNLELYQAARDARNFEIQLFWQRSNYFLVLNTAIAVGYVSRSTGDPLTVALSIAGIVVSFLWVCVNLGSKYWQSRWEQRLVVVENQLGDDLELFSASWPTLDGDVRRSLANSGPRGPLHGSTTRPS